MIDGVESLAIISEHNLYFLLIFNTIIHFFKEC